MAVLSSALPRHSYAGSPRPVRRSLPQQFAASPAVSVLTRAIKEGAVPPALGTGLGGLAPHPSSWGFQSPASPYRQSVIPAAAGTITTPLLLGVDGSLRRSTSTLRRSSPSAQTPAPLATAAGCGALAARAAAVTVMAPRASSRREGGSTGDNRAMRASLAPPRFENGAEIDIGEHRFRCAGVLGRGSYGEVWRAAVLAGAPGLEEVALKEVACGSQAELQQAIFEVQVLLALERAASPSLQKPLRVPRCIAYKIDPCGQGWKVRTAMTVVPGESLDYFIRRRAPEHVTRSAALRRGCALAVKLIRDIWPMLQLLAPIAWHRDVNSHNILISGNVFDAEPEDILNNAAFWLIDFGLAVDSTSWASAQGKWRTEYIGGDSRYWPPSSWVMHLLGPEGFEGRDDLCDQYQRRLDIHGLGITALELLCTVALAAAPPAASSEEEEAWEPVLEAWKKYRTDVWQWWSAVYQVFSTGGDIAPVQAQLVKDRVVEQLLTLLGNLRQSLQRCAQKLPEAADGRVLVAIADMIDEGCQFELSSLDAALGAGSASVGGSSSLSAASARRLPSAAAAPNAESATAVATQPDGMQQSPSQARSLSRASAQVLAGHVQPDVSGSVATAPDSRPAVAWPSPAASVQDDSLRTAAEVRVLAAMTEATAEMTQEQLSADGARLRSQQEPSAELTVGPTVEAEVSSADGPAPAGSDTTPFESSLVAFRARIRSLECTGEAEYARLLDKVRLLDEGLQRLGQESLERAKLGMKKLSEENVARRPSRQSLHRLPRPHSSARPPITPPQQSIVTKNVMSL